MGNVKINKIEIDLGNGNIVELTLEQAKDLHRLLEGVFKPKDLPSIPIKDPIPWTPPQRDDEKIWPWKPEKTFPKKITWFSDTSDSGTVRINLNDVI